MRRMYYLFEKVNTKEKVMKKKMDYDKGGEGGKGESEWVP